MSFGQACKEYREAVLLRLALTKKHDEICKLVGKLRDEIDEAYTIEENLLKELAIAVSDETEEV